MTPERGNDNVRKDTRNVETRRMFIPSLNPRASVSAWEISPCRELPDYGGGTVIQAYETLAEAEDDSEDAVGEPFWGVYVRPTGAGRDAGWNPSVHLLDFPTLDEAVAFVRLVNGEGDAIPGTSERWRCDDEGESLIICNGPDNEHGEREEIATLHANRPTLAASQRSRAKLMAAAPELLAALRWIASSNYTAEAADLIDKARAAIRQTEAT